MGQDVVTLEYASGVGERMGVPWKWGLVGVAVVNIATAYVTFLDGFLHISAWDAFAEMLRSMFRGYFPAPLVLLSLSVNFIMAPVLAYLTIRVSLGRLRWVERMMGYGSTLVCVAPVLMFMGAMWMDWAGAPSAPMTGGTALAAALSVVSSGVLAFGGIVAWRVRQSHKPGVEFMVLLMACYVANACWALLLALEDWNRPGGLQPGAWMCAGVSVWFIVEMAVMWVRDRAWRRGVRESCR